MLRGGNEQSGGLRRFLIVAMGASLLLHAAVLGVVTLFGWESTIADDDALVDRVYVSFEQPAPPPLPPSHIPPPKTNRSKTVEPEPALGPDKPAEQTLDTKDRTAIAAVDDDRAIDVPRRESVPSDYEEVREGDEGSGDASGGGAPDEVETAPRALPEIGFAGLGASNVRSVVYVVDASGPMVSTLANVVGELERSMLALDPAQEFQVVFVNGGGYAAAPNTDGSAGMIRAMPSGVRGVAEWCRTIRAHGKSDPLPALEYALGMQPDVVFLFSRVSSYIGPYERNREDRLAMLRSRVLGRLDELNPQVGHDGARRTVIKVVQFYDKDPSGLFRAIAAEHGGEGAYRFITRETGSLR